jgi:hypothetical protein
VVFIKTNKEHPAMFKAMQQWVQATIARRMTKKRLSERGANPRYRPERSARLRALLGLCHAGLYHA